ncbi:MAG: hypothetical protein LAQ69_02080 [Acidobacteriia bacterium]|nr:hypothetical protein [Terriglobia bacterium]
MGFGSSLFLRQVTDGGVDFRVPARPRYVYLVNPKEYVRRVGLEWIGHQVPRADTRWMGELLAHLSPRQIRDAFRAAGYSPPEVADRESEPRLLRWLLSRGSTMWMT